MARIIFELLPVEPVAKSLYFQMHNVLRTHNSRRHFPVVTACDMAHNMRLPCP